MDFKTDFENIGRGISIAAGWLDINGTRQWVDFMAATEGKAHAKKRYWHVLAGYGHGPDRVKAEGAVTCGYRYEAAELALEALRAAKVEPEAVNA